MYLIFCKVDTSGNYQYCYHYSSLTDAQAKYQELLAEYSPSQLQLLETSTQEYHLSVDENGQPTISEVSYPIATTSQPGMVQLATILQASYSNPVDNVNGIPVSVQPSLIKSMIDAGLLIERSYTNTHAPTVTTIKEALNDLYNRVTYTALEITSFTTARTLYDKGQTASVTFLWTYNKDITSQTLDSVTVAATERTSTIQAADSKSIVLSATDGVTTESKTIALTFTWRMYWGVSSSTTGFDASFIKGLGNSRLATTYKGSYAFNQTTGTYGYIAGPSSYNIPAMAKIYGFDTELTNCGNIDFTNDYGQSTTYILYRTTNPSLGSYEMIFA